MEQPKNMLFCVEKYNARNIWGKILLKYIHVPVYFINYFPRTHSHQVICFKFFFFKHLRNLFETLDMMFTCANFVP